MKINDLRKNLKDKKLHELEIGECFIYEDELFIYLNNYSDTGNICVYSLTYDVIQDLLPTTQVTPVKVELNIIE